MLHFSLGKSTSKVKSKANITLICPILEYVTKVWGPLHQSLIHKIEKGNLVGIFNLRFL